MTISASYTTPRDSIGFEDVYRSSTIHEVACMAHFRRRFVVIYRSKGSPIAAGAINRIAQLYAAEKGAPRRAA